MGETRRKSAGSAGVFTLPENARFFMVIDPPQGGKKEKERMKKLFAAACAAILALSAFAFAACAPKTVVVDETAVIITPSDKILPITENTVLADYMDKLVERKELEFTAADGMITSLNGKANTTNSYWMLYTDDTENSSADWGTTEYDGKTFRSATLGFASLPVKAGCTYIWVYQSFSF